MAAQEALVGDLTWCFHQNRFYRLTRARQLVTVEATLTGNSAGEGRDVLDYLAYLWARDITEETVGARRRLLAEVLDIEERRGRRPRSRPARVLQAWGDRVGSAHRAGTHAQRYS